MFVISDILILAIYRGKKQKYCIKLANNPLIEKNGLVWYSTSTRKLVILISSVIARN